MKNSILLLLIMFLFLSNEKANDNLIQKNDEGWESLFDGKTLNGWHRYNRKGVKPIWTAKKGVLLLIQI